MVSSEPVLVVMGIVIFVFGVVANIPRVSQGGNRGWRDLIAKEVEGTIGECCPVVLRSMLSSAKLVCVILTVEMPSIRGRGE